jgi:hypothetical protein
VNRRYDFDFSHYSFTFAPDESSEYSEMNLKLSVEIGFEQLLEWVAQLPAPQKKQLIEALQNAETPPSQHDSSGEPPTIWDEAAARQFLNGYAESDSIYDKI